jgi:MOSC domain-containing protein YiiM
VQVRKLNLAGDQQSDLTVHGGVDKAVYVYPSEHYAFWRNELPNIELDWGAFGENFTTEGALDDKAVHIRNRFRIGSAEFSVTQPRMPCFKLGIRFGRADIIKRFLHSGRNGFYFSVAQEGEVAAGDSIELLARDENGVSVADIVELYTADATKQDLLQRVSELAALPENWRAYFRKRLWKPDA